MKRERQHRDSSGPSQSRSSPTAPTRRTRNGQTQRHQVRSTHPARLAELFMMTRGQANDGTPLIRRWREDWYRWRPELGYYAAVDDERGAADLRAFLETVDIVDENDKASHLRVTRAVVSEVSAALHPLTLIDGDIPRWISGSGPPPDELLVARNGLYHLPTSKLSPASPAYFATAGLGAPIPHEPGEPNEWLQFLKSIWPDDAESITTLQDFVGYTLTPSTRLHKGVLLIGPRRSGKGTIARVLRELLGRDNVAGPTLGSLGDRFGLWPLLGKRLAVIPDARISGRSDQAPIVERLLSITGEDALTIDRKNREPVTTSIGARFLICSNEIPRLNDSSGAFASRFLILVLRESFLGREDHHLTDRLLGELPQILGWAIEGWHRLRARGRFVQPTSGAESVSELERLASPFRAFIDDECELGSACEVTVDALFARWKWWCDREGRERPGDKQAFARGLHACVPHLITVRLKLLDGSRPRAFRGIRLAGAST